MSDMDSKAKEWCADTSLTMAIEQIAKEDGISKEDALERFVSTPIYNALYALDTGLWSVGPANLIFLYRKHTET